VSSSGAEGSEAAPPRLPALHLVTDADILARPDFREAAAALLAEGGHRVALHLRGHGGGGAPTPARQLYALASGLLPLARDAGALLVVNDRVDVALASGVGGVQLGGGSLRPGELPAGSQELAVGRSVHGAEQARAALDADWLLVGTLYPTPSHPGRPGDGPGVLTALGGVVGAPRIGIGGITPERVAEVLGAGAHGVAVRGGVWGAPDPSDALHRYLSALHGPSDSDTSQRP